MPPRFRRPVDPPTAQGGPLAAHETTRVGTPRIETARTETAGMASRDATGPRARERFPHPARIAARVAIVFAGSLVAARGEVTSVAAADEKPPYRIALVGPMSGALAGCGADALAGAQAAAAWKSAHGGVGGRAVNVETFDDADTAAGAEKAFAAAQAARIDAIVAASSGRTVDALAAKVRKFGRLPAVFVGSGAPKPSLDPHDPVLFVGSWLVDQAIHVADFLVIPCRAKKPALVVEASPRGEEAAAAFARNLGEGKQFVGVAKVAPGDAMPADSMRAWKEKGCDRVVVVGEPDLFEAVVLARAALGWDVPLLGGEGTLSSAAPSVEGGRAAPAHFVVGSPQRTMDGAPRPLDDAVEKARRPGATAVVMPRSVAAYTAAELLVDAAQPAGKHAAKEAEILAALREVRYGADETKTPFFELTGRASLYHWTLWQADAKGLSPTDARLLPAEGFGPMMGLRRPSVYKAEPGTKVVWLTFGDKTSKPPRTIDKELAELNLATRGYEGSLDQFMLDELMARAMGKLHRLFSRNEDGTPIPGVSFNVSFTTTKPDLKPNEYWTAVLAGDDPDAGGRAFPGESRCEIYATFLRRTIFQKGAIAPRVDHDDLAWVNGTYPWKGVPIEALRADQIRSLVDGYAGAFALTGAHELGHLAGLGHDTTDERSIMNVAEGAGLRETAAFFIPAHAQVLERLLGRAALPKR